MLYDDLAKITQNGKKIFTLPQGSNPTFMEYTGNYDLERINRGKSFKCFIDTDDRRLFFKETTENETLGEILSAELGNKLGLNVIDPVVVDIDFNLPYSRKDSKSGIIMTSYLANDNNTEAISARRLMRMYGDMDSSIERRETKFTAFNLANAALKMKAEKLKEDINLILPDNFLLDHVKLAIFDYIKFQTDRHNHNIEYIYKKIDEHNHSLELAPIYDNALSFELTMEKQQIELIRDTKQNGFTTPYNVLRKMMFSQSGVYLLENKEQVLSDTIKDIAKLAVCRKEVLELVQKIFNIDIDKVITHATVKNNIKINNNFRFIAREVYNYRKELLLTAIEKQKEQRSNTKRINQISEDEINGEM